MEDGSEPHRCRESACGDRLMVARRLTQFCWQIKKLIAKCAGIPYLMVRFKK
jgi:hypothetical protein